MVGNGGLVSRGRVIVGPIYLWGVERIVPELLEKSALSWSCKIYAHMMGWPFSTSTLRHPRSVERKFSLPPGAPTIIKGHAAHSLPPGPDSILHMGGRPLPPTIKGARAPAIIKGLHGCEGEGPTPYY